jgi:tRNA threonylcarbamoyl adenosine modification protein YeaZ
MYGLALDTSNKLQLALLNEDRVVDTIVLKEKINISDVILQYIATLIDRNKITLKDINYITLINGAGYFTGVRIAIVVAKIFRLSLNIPVFTFSTSFIMFKEISDSLLESNFVVSSVDIGKSGCVISVFSKQEQIVSDIYVDEDNLADFFKNHESLSGISLKNLVIIGNKQSLFKEIDYFAEATYCDNLVATSMKILGMEAIKSYNRGDLQPKIEPLYAKEADVIIKQGK